MDLLSLFRRKKKSKKAQQRARTLAILILGMAIVACGTSATLVPKTSSPATQEPTLVPAKMPATAQPSLVPTKRSTATTAPTAVRAAPTIPLATATLARVSWPCPADTAGALYIGNTNSNKFHTISHAISSGVKPEHRLCSATRQAAIGAGFVPCGTCKP